MYKEVYDYLSPLSATVYKWLDIFFGRSRVVHQLFSTIILFLNAVIFNLLLVRNRAYSENNYLPGFFYVLLSFTITDFFILSPQLMSSTFVLLALNNVFRRIDNQASDELFLYAGLYLGIATLFYFPSIIFFIVFLGALLVFSNAILRRILLYVYGLTVPILVVFGYYYWFDASDYFYRSVIWRGLLNYRIQFVDLKQLFIVGLVPLIWWVISMTRTLFAARYGIYESKIMRTMLYMTLAALILIVIDVEFSTTQLVFFVPTISYFLTYYALNLRRKVFRIIAPAFIVLTLLVPPFFFVYQGHLSSYIVSRKTTGELQKKMILGESLEDYRNAKIASPFIDQTLSLRNLEDLQYYKDAYSIYQSIARNKPEVIVDEWGIIPDIFMRFPILSVQYEKSSETQYNLISN